MTSRLGSSGSKAPDRTRRPGFLPVALLAAISLLTEAQHADAQVGFEAAAWRPAPNIGRNILDVQTANLGGRLEWSANAFFAYAHEPVVLEGFDGLMLPYSPTSTRVLGAQTTLRLLGSFSPTDWLEAGIDLPLVLTQQGDRLAGTTDPNGIARGAGLGDLRLVARFRFVEVAPKQAGHFRLGASVDVDLPTGDRERLQGGGGHLTGLALIDWESPWGPHLAVNMGYSWRPTTSYLGVDVGHGIAWGVGLEIPILTHVRVLAAARGDQSTEATLAVTGTLFNVEAVAGVGLPLIADEKAPAWRLFGGVGYRRPSAADADRDGIVGAADRCPTEAEDLDHFEDEDGCPDLDNDADGVADEADRCPTEPEDRDGFQDDDGCPDTDNDEDGIADRVDRCLGEPEDRDGFEDGDGCPDPDNDRDGIADADDRCPLDAEDVDQDEDEDGCPDISEATEISQVVYFEVGSATIQQTDRYALGRLARVIAALPRGMHVWVEGYADDSGSKKGNEGLAQQRAQAVIDFLVERGAPQANMTARPYGERIAAYVNESDADRRVNRRVEFRVGARTLSDEQGADADSETSTKEAK